MKSQGIQVTVDEDTELQQYSDTMHMLQSKGYEHYEVSNWALPGFASLHNISYWNGSSYLALGPAGHSFDGVKPVPGTRGMYGSGCSSYVKPEQEFREKRY